MKKITLLGVMAILCLYLNTVLAQNNITISGTVRNAAGKPLSGATVTNTRTGKGTVTSATGAFTLHGTNEKDKLRISYIGYAAQTITVGNERKLAITLKDATNELDKVVVQAYGVTSDRLRTGNISKVTAADIAKQPMMNVLNVLQGQTPGLDVVNTSGYASGVIKVEIRGRNLINSGFSSDPLYVIDGVPLTIQDMWGRDSYWGGSYGINQGGIVDPANGQSPFFNINPADIESIEVLKDADATAIYGSRGAKGVILITTKKGRPGKVSFGMNASAGKSDIMRTYELLNTRQYVAMRREALENDGLPVDVINAPDLLIWDTTRYTNWQRELMSGGSSVMANSTLSGGNLFTTFRISADYSRNKDLSTFSGANQRAAFSTNLGHQSANRRLQLNLSSFFTTSRINLVGMPYLLALPPNAPGIWDVDGNPNYSGWVPLDDLYQFGVLNTPYETRSNMLNANLNTRYEIVKGLNYKTNLGYGSIQSNQASYEPIKSQNPKYNSKGSNQFGLTTAVNSIVEPQLEYNGFVGIGKLNVLMGGSWQNNKTSYSRLMGNGYTNDALLRSINNAPVRSANNGNSLYNYAAFFGRIGYNISDRYIVNFNGRRDGSSRFGPGRQFGNFGSIGAAWLFGDEVWIKNNLPFISFGKLRASYGTTGGDDIGNYQFLSRWIFAPPNRSYNNTLPLNPVSHLDSLIQWQVNYKTEWAFTLSFFNDRLTVDLSWYRNRCNNQLVNFPTPAYTGFGSVLTNSPANVENKGWELILKGQPAQTKNFTWEVSANVSHNRNRLISYPNFEQSPYFGTYEIGQPLNQVRVLHYIGVDPETGLYSFEDKNNSGKIERNKPREDDTYWLNRTPAFFGGLTNTVNWKRWQVSFLFYFKKQIGQSILGSVNYPGGIYNEPIGVLNRWQKPGDKTNTPRFSTNPASVQVSNFGSSDGAWEDASFIRLQNFVINYRISESLCKGLSLANGGLFFKAQNLLLFSGYNGLDPETQTFYNPPLPRILTAGISLNF